MLCWYVVNRKSRKIIKKTRSINSFIDYFYNNTTTTTRTKKINQNCKHFYNFYKNNFDNDKFAKYNSNPTLYIPKA